MAAKTVGLVGIGKMGSVLLDRLRAAGHRVRAFDISEPAMKAAAAGGAEIAASPAAAASGCAFIHVFLATDAQVTEVMNAPDGVFAGSKPGAIILLHSTILPATTRAVAAQAPPGVTVLDAPVASMPRALAAGDGMFLLGGAGEAVAAARAHLAPLGKAVYHMGPLGAANIAKIARNLGNVVERVMAAEIARLVEAAGLDIGQFLEMVASASRTGIWKEWPRMLTVENGHAAPKRASGLVSKDIVHAMSLAAELGLDLPVARATAHTAAEWLAAWRAEAAAQE